MNWTEREWLEGGTERDHLDGTVDRYADPQEPTLPGMPPDLVARPRPRTRALGPDDLRPTGLERMVAQLAGVTVPHEWRTTLEPHTHEVVRWRLHVTARGRADGNVSAHLDHATSRPPDRAWAVWSTLPGYHDHGPTPQAALDAFAERLARWRDAPT